MKRTGSLLILLFVLLVIGCAGSRPTPVRPEPAAAVIKVVGADLPALSFAKVVVDIPPQRGIGYHHVGLEYTRDQEYLWDPHFEDETSELNSRSVAVLTEAGYRTAPAGQGDLNLVGTIGPLAYNSYTRKTGTFDQADCTVKWELSRPGEKVPFYVQSIPGSGRVADHKPGAIGAAYEVSLRNLLATPEFVAAVRGALAGTR